MVSKATSVTQDQLAQLVVQVDLANKVIQVVQVSTVEAVIQVSQVPVDLLVWQESQVFQLLGNQVIPVQMVQMVLMVTQALQVHKVTEVKTVKSVNVMADLVNSTHLLQLKEVLVNHAHRVHQVLPVFQDSKVI